jgi:hypothetical protein
MLEQLSIIKGNKCHQQLKLEHLSGRLRALSDKLDGQVANP